MCVRVGVVCSPLPTHGYGRRRLRRKDATFLKGKFFRESKQKSMRLPLRCIFRGKALAFFASSIIKDLTNKSFDNYATVGIDLPLNTFVKINYFENPA
jgi:hypothetical protein